MSLILDKRSGHFLKAFHPRRDGEFGVVRSNTRLLRARI
jgi:hypothetical protein